MIYTLTLNPSLDAMMWVDALQIGSVNRAAKECQNPGGKGINVSQALQNLGHDSIAMGLIAGKTGEQIQKMLNDRGCRTDFLALSQGCSRINVKLFGRETTEVNGVGPEVTVEEIETLMRKLLRIAPGDWLVLSGSAPKSCAGAIYADAMHALRPGVRVVVDAEKALLAPALREKPFFVKPNHHELGSFFGVAITTMADAEIYGRELQALGAQRVLVSMGKAGAVYIPRAGDALYLSAPEGKAVNAVGTGDAMVAGFIAGWLENNGDEEKAAAFAVAMGSATAFSNTIASREEAETLYESVIHARRGAKKREET